MNEAIQSKEMERTNDLGNTHFRSIMKFQNTQRKEKLLCMGEQGLTGQLQVTDKKGKLSGIRLLSSITVEVTEE